MLYWLSDLGLRYLCNVLLVSGSLYRHKIYDCMEKCIINWASFVLNFLHFKKAIVKITYPWLQRQYNQIWSILKVEKIVIFMFCKSIRTIANDLRKWWRWFLIFYFLYISHVQLLSYNVSIFVFHCNSPELKVYSLIYLLIHSLDMPFCLRRFSYRWRRLED